MTIQVVKVSKKNENEDLALFIASSYHQGLQMKESPESKSLRNINPETPESHVLKNPTCGHMHRSLPGVIIG